MLSAPWGGSFSSIKCGANPSAQIHPPQWRGSGGPAGLTDPAPCPEGRGTAGLARSCPRASQKAWWQLAAKDPVLILKFFLNPPVAICALPGTRCQVRVDFLPVGLAAP